MVYRADLHRNPLLSHLLAGFRWIRGGNEWNLIDLIPVSLLALPLRLKSKDSPCSLINVTLDLLVFLRGLEEMV